MQWCPCDESYYERAVNVDRLHVCSTHRAGSITNGRTVMELVFIDTEERQAGPVKVCRAVLAHLRPARFPMLIQ